MTPLKTPSSAHPPLMELVLWLLKCKSYQELVHEQVELNRDQHAVWTAKPAVANDE